MPDSRKVALEAADLLITHPERHSQQSWTNAGRLTLELVRQLADTDIWEWPAGLTICAGTALLVVAVRHGWTPPVSRQGSIAVRSPETLAALGLAGDRGPATLATSNRQDALAYLDRMTRR